MDKGRCIQHTHRDLKGMTWCGREIEPTGWVFQNIDHAVYNEAVGGVKCCIECKKEIDKIWHYGHTRDLELQLKEKGMDLTDEQKRATEKYNRFREETSKLYWEQVRRIKAEDEARRKSNLKNDKKGIRDDTRRQTNS